MTATRKEGGKLGKKPRAGDAKKAPKPGGKPGERISSAKAKTVNGVKKSRALDGAEKRKAEQKAARTPKQKPLGGHKRAHSKNTHPKEAVGQEQVFEQKKAAEAKDAKKKKQDLDPFEVAKQTMRGSVPAIVKAMVELAKQGSCSHAKTLLEMTGARYMFDSEEAEREDSGEPWAKLVLERLDAAELLAAQAIQAGQEIAATVGAGQ